MARMGRPGSFWGVVIDGSELVDQEQFSPILPIIRVTDAEDALKHVNSTGYGLYGSVWSSDMSRARELAARIQTDTVWTTSTRTLGRKCKLQEPSKSGTGLELDVYGLEDYAGKLSPNMGRPLTDSFCVASSCNTSQCSARRPSSNRTTSAAIQAAGLPIPVKRPWAIT
jgi:acyl-CoA reductase-like NAD-dependent aldehyde dehydrogenase